MKEKFSVTGMTCSACSSGIERTLNKKDGIEKCEVSLMTESMQVVYDPEKISREAIIRQVQSLGYGADVYDEKKIKNQSLQTDKLKRRFLLSLLFLVPLMYFSMGGMIVLPVPEFGINAIIQAVISAVIIAINYSFFTSGVKALFKGVANMDTLVSMGAAVSYGYSLVLTILHLTGTHAVHEHLFYESAAMILALVTLGKWLEEKSKRKTGQEVEKLIKLMPSKVLVERNGAEEEIEFADVQLGDLLIIKQGDYIPVDGKIVQGSAFVDRAAITGESLPVEVAEGDAVTSADIVKSGYIKVLAEKVGAETTLSQIVRMVKEAGASKAPIQKTADKIAGIFVPAVTLIAVFTFVIWMLTGASVGVAANYAISVLVISCPCSLGLATPVAVMAATGRGMALGVLYKDAEALQKVRDVNCALLDKTATLTVGQPKVTDFTAISGEEEFLLGLAYAIESQSNHPIAECIKRFAEEKIGNSSLVIKDYVYYTGKGAMAVFNGKTYSLGNRKSLEEKLLAKV
ncbi:MAG: heavy metal translocating P-type ATPase, partial [Clostridia bacterium]|nr:heavy metal translocating P-type ATPase [Clostridia bacterium]